MNSFVMRVYSIAVFAIFSFAFAGTLLAFDHSHQLFDQTLKKHVVKLEESNLVKYGELKKDSSDLNEYIREIEAVKFSEYKQWSTSGKMAFLINAYNALTLKLILSKYPDIESIRDLGWLFFTPWKRKFFVLFGEKRHLDYIEHELLRKRFNEPRIHFAIVCASRGCPALRRESYIEEKLEKQLEEAAKGFMRNELYNRFDRERGVLEISYIFKWFKEDFVKSAGSLKSFIAPLISDDPKRKELMLGDEIEVVFLEYDWSLNKAGE